MRNMSRELVVAANQWAPSRELHPGAFAFRLELKCDGRIPLSERVESLCAFNKGGTTCLNTRPLGMGVFYLQTDHEKE